MALRRCWSCVSDYRYWLLLVALVLIFNPLQCSTTRLYSSTDPLTILTSETLKKSLQNSSTAWLVQFYSSWCGHCIQYAPTWSALAGDVKDWDTAIRIGVLDCADEKNFDTCKEYGIHFYPTFRYFKARNSQPDTGKTYRGADRELPTVRQLMVTFLQNHSQEDWPPACPPLEPSRALEILSLLGQKSHQYTAVIFEDEKSFVGREVILDLMPYKGLNVTRVAEPDKIVREKLGIESLPSGYLFSPDGSHGLIDVQKPLRFFFSSYLKLLPGVRRKQARRIPEKAVSVENGIHVAWKEFNKSKVYMADLESGLHYLLRVELASHKTLEGEELKTFKDFVTVVAKLFPGRQPVVKLLETLLEWLISLPIAHIPYDAILDLVNNKMRISGMFLTNKIDWVGCQGSQPELRGYPCSLWLLFHTLTVQAAERPDALANTGLEDNPQAVLQTMRKYITTFFGCQECGRHFEEMAKESMNQVNTADESVLWLWKKHNIVNNRLAGALSEDPMFPKTSWPTPDLCPACHEEVDGLHTWNEKEVLAFLKRHYVFSNMSPKYTAEQEGPVPGNQADKEPAAVKVGGDAPNPVVPSVRPALPEKHQNKEKPEANVISQKEQKPGVTFLVLGFSNIDMSLCVLLYVASCLFLMVMFFFFRMRSKRWKIKHNRLYV
ncbi:sulfhydryl oxidase 2 [Erpetoichthys calabaricus]|uniref:Sulfhydryl oxidase n=1 Tax=Erpetoichthys calabaricus TaxID=27687 RepID=A0A8C4SZP6_ERPCA|nr:sulfhydryl oxidase 2 [Erpetoichthys calabaricus]